MFNSANVLIERMRRELHYVFFFFSNFKIGCMASYAAKRVDIRALFSVLGRESFTITFTQGFLNLSRCHQSG